MATMNEAAVRPTIAHVHYDDGHTDEVDIGRPGALLKLARLGDEVTDIERGIALVWFASGQPGGTLEQWVETVARIDMPDESDAEDPTSGGSST